jgi:hypothetical protein
VEREMINLCFFDDLSSTVNVKGCTPVFAVIQGAEARGSLGTRVEGQLGHIGKPCL